MNPSITVHQKAEHRKSRVLEVIIGKKIRAPFGVTELNNNIIMFMLLIERGECSKITVNNN